MLMLASPVQVGIFSYHSCNSVILWKCWLLSQVPDKATAHETPRQSKIECVFIYTYTRLIMLAYNNTFLENVEQIYLWRGENSEEWAEPGTRAGLQKKVTLRALQQPNLLSNGQNFLKTLKPTQLSWLWSELLTRRLLSTANGKIKHLTEQFICLSLCPSLWVHGAIS